MVLFGTGGFSLDLGRYGVYSSEALESYDVIDTVLACWNTYVLGSGLFAV